MRQYPPFTPSLLLLLAFLSFSHGIKYEDVCPAPPTAKAALEGVLTSEEELTGIRCFNLFIQSTLMLNKVHLSVLRNNETQLCRDMKVTSVEFMAIGYMVTNKVHGRIPLVIGEIVRDRNQSALSVCDVDKTFKQLHYPHEETSAVIKQQCKTEPGHFSTNWSSSLEFKSRSAGVNLEGPPPDNQNIIACSLWQYRPVGRIYPENQTIKDVEFVAQLSLMHGNRQLFRQLTRRSYYKSYSIIKLPAIRCNKTINVTIYWTDTPIPESTTPMFETTEAIGNKLTDEPGDEYTDYTELPTIKTTTRIPPSTTPTYITYNRTEEQTIEVDCMDHDNCVQVEKFFQVPMVEVQTSFFDSVSDACLCHGARTVQDYTPKKYKYGGFNHGIQDNQISLDTIFQDCLAFRFDPQTNCAVFTLTPRRCDIDLLNEMTLEEFSIFALATNNSNSSQAEPFGRWEKVEVFGNCGNLIIDKASPARREISAATTNEKCNFRSLMAKGSENDDPQMFRVVLDPPISLAMQKAGTESDIGVEVLVEDSVFVTRFHPDETFKPVNEAQISTVPKYINFVLEAYTLVDAVDGQSSEKIQIVSLKTPIMEIQFSVKGKDETGAKFEEHKIIGIGTSSAHHDPSYLQLAPYIHDELYYADKDTCPWVMEHKGVLPPRPPPAYENTCYCYAKPRTENIDRKLPMTFEEFVEAISKIDPNRNDTANCFVFDFHVEPDKTKRCQVKDGIHTVRVLVMFSVTCTGSEGFEVRDAVFQANNHKGYPIGNWKDIKVKHEGEAPCEKSLRTAYKNKAEEASNTKAWKIREVKPVSHHKCPNATEHDHETEEEKLKYFFQRKNPEMLFYNHNLTLWVQNSTDNYGFCTWWTFSFEQDHLFTKDETTINKDFYLDYQLIATAHIVHRKSNTIYIVEFQKEKTGFNLRDCEVDRIAKSSEYNRHIYLDKVYFDTRTRREQQECLGSFDFDIEIEKELCKCFVGRINITREGENEKNVFIETHRVQLEKYDHDDPVVEAAYILQQCISVSYVLNGTAQRDFEIVVRYRIRPALECEGRFWLYEVVFQVMNEHGLPMGTWDKYLINTGHQCDKTPQLGEAELDTFKCPFNQDQSELYKTDAKSVEILRFKNRWKDEYYTDMCVRWRYPKSYVTDHRKTTPGMLPETMQIYVQSHVYDKVLDERITSPRFTSTKIKFSDVGNFKTEVPKLDIQVWGDYNSRLILNYDKGRESCLLPYPLPPVYISYTCLMFHPSQHGGRIRIDLNDPEDTRAEKYRYHKCFEFDAFPGNKPLTMHLRFRQTGTHPDCRKAKGIYFGFTAYNELGYPIGLADLYSGWIHYDKNATAPGDHHYCENEDLGVHKSRLLHASDPEHVQCQFFPDNLNNVTEALIPEYYTQYAHRGALPFMMIANLKEPTKSQSLDGLCVQWQYAAQDKGQRTPKRIQFYLEFFVPLDAHKLEVGDVLVIRSKVFTMSYKGGDHLKNVPNPAKNCHDEQDQHGIFKALDWPTDLWYLRNEYNIYPNKKAYRACKDEFMSSGGCLGIVKEPEEVIIINPVVIIPGVDPDDEELRNLRFNSTKYIYDGCLGSKPCYSPIQYYKGLREGEADCILAQNCELVWAVGKQPINIHDKDIPEPGDDNIVLELYAVTKAWVAIGISEDQLMGEDYVLECVNENGTVKLYNSWNYEAAEFIGKNKHDNIRVGEPDKTIARLVISKHDENSVYCMIFVSKSFRITNPQSSIVHDFDLGNEDKQYCILTAYSDNLKTRKAGGKTVYLGIGTHYESKRSGRAPCRSWTSLATRYMPDRSQVKILQQHGALLTLSYMGFLTISIFVARYYKTTLTALVHGYEIWVWVHGISASICLLLEFFSCIQLIRGVKGWDSPITSPFHHLMGYLGMLLIFSNVCIGYYIRRTEKIYERASCYYMFHGIGGHFSCMGGLFIVMLSTRLEYAFMPCKAGHLAKIFVLVYMAIHIAMAFNRYWLNKAVGEKDWLSMDFFNPLTLLTQKYTEDAWYIEPPRVSLIKKVILIIFCAFALGTSLAIIIQILGCDHSCKLESTYKEVKQIVPGSYYELEGSTTMSSNISNSTAITY